MSISVDDNLVIDVTDDGVGILEMVASSGLHNLAHRAAAAGGTFSCLRRVHGGTRLLWSAPLPLTVHRCFKRRSPTRERRKALVEDEPTEQRRQCLRNYRYARRADLR